MVNHRTPETLSSMLHDDARVTANACHASCVPEYARGSGSQNSASRSGVTHVSACRRLLMDNSRALAEAQLVYLVAQRNSAEAHTVRAVADLIRRGLADGQSSPAVPTRRAIRAMRADRYAQSYGSSTRVQACGTYASGLQRRVRLLQTLRQMQGGSMGTIPC
jgi:hypothetical protein